MMDMNDTLRGAGEDGIRGQFDEAWIRRHNAIEAAHAVFRKWLSKAYDVDILDCVLAARASHELDGDPLWLLVISGSGAAKTETVSSLGETGAFTISSISSDAALLSGSPKKSRVKEATGGLLRTIGEDGVVVIKDVTSILSMNSNVRAPILAAFREIYDGRWERNLGTDGGQTLKWEGRLTVIGACTTAWDEAHGVIASMGDRFVLVRFDSAMERSTTGWQAISNSGREKQMRQELGAAVKDVIDAMTTTIVELTEDEISQILNVADAVTFLRTGVMTDNRGEILDGHAPEAPTRFAKQLTQIFRGALAIGLSRDRAMQLAIRCAHDSTPPARLAIALAIDEKPGTILPEISQKLNKPKTTTRRVLNALRVLELIAARKNTDETEGYWIAVKLNASGLAALRSGNVNK